MNILESVLSYGKLDFRGHGKVSDRLVVKKGRAPEIAQIRASHGSHSQTTHSSSQ